MTSSWHELIEKDGCTPEWPYPIRYEQEQTVETDVLVIGGGIAGCRAAISAAQREGLRVAMVEKAAMLLLDSNLRIWPDPDLLAKFEPVRASLEQEIKKLSPVDRLRSLPD